MGQVRINRSKKPKPETARVSGGATERRRQSRRCGWVKNAFPCHSFTGIIKPTCFSPVWRKWKSFSHASFSKKSEKRSSSSRSEPIFGRSTVEPEEPEETRKEENQEEEASSCKSFTATPPRNAFLLTRCRSAPYRSPSSANSLFEDQEETNKAPFQRHASSENVSVSEEPKTSVTETTERLEDSRRESAASEEPKRSVLGSPRQCLILTRCNSEPARLVPEMGYRQNPRLGFTWCVYIFFLFLLYFFEKFTLKRLLYSLLDLLGEVSLKFRALKAFFIVENLVVPWPCNIFQLSYLWQCN
jgi:hypothetical protein